MPSLFPTFQHKHKAISRNQHDANIQYLTLSPTLSPFSRPKLPICLSPSAVDPFPQKTHANFTNTSFFGLLILVLLVLAVVAGPMEAQAATLLKLCALPMQHWSTATEAVAGLISLADWCVPCKMCSTTARDQTLSTIGREFCR